MHACLYIQGSLSVRETESVLAKRGEEEIANYSQHTVCM